VELSVAMLHCLWETQAGPEIAPLLSRNVSCWKNVLQHIHEGCSTHRRCFADVLQPLPETSGSGCDSSVVLAVTAVRPVDSDHTAHRGGRKTRLGHIRRAS